MSETGSPRERHIDIWSTVLLSIAVILSAWSGYQAARWSGEQAIAFSAANSARLESTRSSTEAGQLTQIDVGTFLSWAEAYSTGNTQLEEFLRARMRAPLRQALVKWIALRPLQNPDAPPTPFALPSYQLPEAVKAEQLSTEAGQQVEIAKRDNQRSDNYVLAVVLFASVLFFAGIATKLAIQWAQMGLLALGTVLMIGTLIWLATFPISFGI